MPASHVPVKGGAWEVLSLSVLQLLHAILAQLVTMATVAIAVSVRLTHTRLQAQQLTHVHSVLLVTLPLPPAGRVVMYVPLAIPVL